MKGLGTLLFGTGALDFSDARILLLVGNKGYAFECNLHTER